MNEKITILLLILLLMSFSFMICSKTAKADNNIAINYTVYNADVTQISNELPQSGCVFVIVNVTITNNGYDSFSTNPTFFVAVNNLDGGYDIDQDGTLNYWQAVTLSNGGTYSGALVFQLPEGANEIKSLSWVGLPGQNYNIVWNGIASTTSNSPTATQKPVATTTPATPEFPTSAVLIIFLVLSVLVVTIPARAHQKA